ncbi:EamA family transporter [Deinococcus yavapaiensis]|uniref:Transporter family protein n=1 Tax=Deinococcus yavapaiensis KR-236 TaxID=694435 RepID=A0A318S2Z5_9DEIO|nr:EamA family transporter [Deinococcus yavapaiensis]PYE52861.1 transporter family protein [Deinococcus yavapaiensis KR-236]
MPNWVLYAFISMLFAGFTSVVAKQGLTGISGELGLTIRTIFVFVFVVLFSLFAVPRQDFSLLTRTNYLWLALSGVTTAVSWVFYYRALKLGEVSTIALIDKGSFIVAVILAWLLLKEQITPRVMLGSALILAGLLVVSRK